jgi:hypothetical protein
MRFRRLATLIAVTARTPAAGAWGSNNHHEPSARLDVAGVTSVAAARIDPT